MDKDIADKQFRHDSRQLAFLIYEFLEDECDEKQYSKNARAEIKKAANLIDKVYKVGFFSYITSPVVPEEYSLEYIFAFGRRPVPVKNRIAAESLKRKGNDFMNTEMFQHAEVAYTKAIELDPRNAIFFCNRAASRIRLRLFADAVTDCKKALELDKSYVKAYCWMGFANAMMDQPGRAISCYRKALRIDPRNSVCIANLDLINKNLNHRVFRVFERLYRFVRLAKNMVNKQILPRQENDSGGDDADGNAAEKTTNYETVKFEQGKLD